MDAGQRSGEMADQSVSLSAAFPVWLRIALLSFGGPAGQIAVMHRILVEEKRWISEDRFLHALSFCMLLPGPEAQQLATYTGWLLHGVRGGLLSGTLFILPGLASILVLSIVYACWQETLLVSALFFGLKPAVLAIVCDASVRMGRRILKTGPMAAVAISAFGLMTFLNLPFPVLIAGAAVLGLLIRRFVPAWLITAQRTSLPSVPGGHVVSSVVAAAAVMSPQPANIRTRDAAELRWSVLPKPTWRRALLISAVCLPLWFGPLIVIRVLAGPVSVFLTEGLFFSRTAVMTFGGAYAVLTHIAHHAVTTFHWLQPREMLDGLGMAETTPGPLIMVVQFVGFMGAWRNPGGLHPLMAGVLGSLITTWVTFVPCFYWIFLGAPSVERLREQHWLNAMLSTVMAAVVGVILHLALWFTLHTVFHETVTRDFGPLRLLLPVPGSFDVAAFAISLCAFGLIFLWHRSLPVTLAICFGLGVVHHLMTRYLQLLSLTF